MSNKSFIISLLILFGTVTSVAAIASRGEPVVVKTNLEHLPMDIAGYRGTEDFLPDSVYEELNADKHVYRHYRSPDKKMVDLYIGYYGTAKGGRTSHNPYGCLPGAGWGILDSHKLTLTPQNYPDPVEVTYVLARKGNFCRIILHWYQSAGNKVLSTGIQQNIQRFLRKIIYNRNDGAFVQLSVFLQEDGIKEANYLVKTFAEKLLDLLPEFWPVEQFP